MDNFFQFEKEIEFKDKKEMLNIMLAYSDFVMGKLEYDETEEITNIIDFYFNSYADI